MLKEKISLDRWNSAQVGEREHHIHESVADSYNNYKSAYKYYFKYLGIETDQRGKSILEIGPARIAASLFIENYSKVFLVEPCEYHETSHLYSEKDIFFIRRPYETCEHESVDEIWMLNLLQHVIDPVGLIEKAKKRSKVIRFFEPIDTQINNEHPHSFSEDDFKKSFGDCVKIYNYIGEPFHTARCAYGVFNCS